MSMEPQAQQGQFPHASPDSLQRDTATAEAQKVTKEEANYRYAGSSNTRCSACAHFSSAQGGSGTCEVVAGTISPDGVSDYYTPARGALRDLVAPPPIGGPV